MLPTGDDAEIMEQSTLNQVFSLFGKGVTQMLQQSVNQQTVIDELRAQNRSLQTQVANLTAAIDEVEDRIFVRLQNMQPTLYTREGIPIDDALDNISSKVQSLNEKIVANAEAITKVDAELTAKVDRDEFEKANNEAQKAGDSFGDLSNTIQTIQKDIQQIRQNAQDSNDRMVQTIKFQIKSQMLNQQMNTEEQDLTDYVTKDELREKLNKLKIEIANGGGDQDDASSIVDFAISGKGLTEEKVKEAYNLLQQRKANVDRNYNKQKKTINQEMSRLMRLAKNVTRTNPNGEEFDADLEEEEDKADNSQQKIEFRTVGIDTVKDIFEEEKTETREPNPRKKRRNIGVTVKQSKKRSKNKKGEKDNAEDDNANENENEDEEDYDEDESVENKSKSKSKKDEKGLDNLIDKMQEEQDQNIQQQQQQITAHADEGKLIQKVLEAVMPRVESLFESLSTTNGNGIKLEKNEAKQLISQLSLLDSLQNEMKNLRMKINMKFDKSVAETELQIRITKEEFFSYLAQLFPENDTLRKMAPHTKSKLPPLNNTRSSSSMATTSTSSNAYSNAHTNSNKNSTTSKNINNNTINNANLNTNTSSNGNVPSNNNISSNANSSSNTYSNANANSGTSSGLNNTYNGGGTNSSASNNNNANNNSNNSNSNNIIYNSNLNNTSNSNNSNISNISASYTNKNGLAESQKIVYTKNSKPSNKGKMVMKPTRNSNMVALNQKFLKGADGHYYLRDTGNDSNEISASLFGTDKTDNSDINAAFDFQPFRRVEESPNVVKNIREDTPNDE